MMRSGGGGVSEEGCYGEGGGSKGIIEAGGG